MSAEFDGAAYGRFLDNEMERHFFPDDEEAWGYKVQEESAEEARQRMSEAEKDADLRWEKQKEAPVE